MNVARMGGQEICITGLWCGDLIERDRSENLCVEGSIKQGGSIMTGTDLCVNKPHCAAAVRP